MNPTDFFSPDHRTARRRFREAAARLDWAFEEHPIGVTGPDGEALAFDVACSPGRRSDQTLVISGGIHGVEAYLGSAVQLALFEGWRSGAMPAPAVNVVFLHGLNAHGFACSRRFDENNVDPNRNFLLPGEAYAGSPVGYGRLNRFLNPPRPPSRWDPFFLKALAVIARMGLAGMKQAVAAGQHDFPKGLFFGGAGPSRMNEIVRDNMRRWLGSPRRVVHLDFHTGLGKWADYELLLDYHPAEGQRAWMDRWYGLEVIAESRPEGISYTSTGGFDRWCALSGFAPDYIALCAEFGTYDPFKMLSGIRAENQAHHWGQPGSKTVRDAKARLRELFCPASPGWRERVLAKSLELADRSMRGMLENA